jgi:hypothetical protein
MLNNLKPNEELMTSSLAVGSVIAIYCGFLPSVADVSAGSTPGQASSKQVHGSVRQTAIMAETVVAGFAVLAKSPTIYVVGTIANVLMAWNYHLANAKSPATGKVQATSQPSAPTQSSASSGGSW